mmetsp:Transcript_56974/g.130830  ORF Transcript_56974/g.130830 Transcript_56974/m.130830 type:complete len:299 (-) Transcript_56974:125-1021(-)
MVVNNKQRLVTGQEFAATSFATKAFSSGVRCGNCPGRGCSECPMFGVGENPTYLQRKRRREKRRQASGRASVEREQARREALIDELFSGGADGDTSAQAAEAESDGALFEALFSEEYGLPEGRGASRAPSANGGDGSGSGSAGGPLSRLRQALGGRANAGASDESSRRNTAMSEYSTAVTDRQASSSRQDGSQRQRAALRDRSRWDRYFALLGVKRGATRAEVKKAYYAQARLLHPDTVAGDARRNPTAAKKFRELTEAYEVICEDTLGCDVSEVTEDIIGMMSLRDAVGSIEEDSGH